MARRDRPCLERRPCTWPYSGPRPCQVPPRATGARLNSNPNPNPQDRGSTRLLAHWSTLVASDATSRKPRPAPET